jgi:hypothetical protein
MVILYRHSSDTYVTSARKFDKSCVQSLLRGNLLSEIKSKLLPMCIENNLFLSFRDKQFCTTALLKRLQALKKGVDNEKR